MYSKEKRNVHLFQNYFTWNYYNKNKNIKEIKSVVHYWVHSTMYMKLSSSRCAIQLDNDNMMTREKCANKEQEIMDSFRKGNRRTCKWQKKLI